MLGSPARGRRRRLIQAFAPSNVAENYYTSVPSFTSGSSFRRRRQSPKARSGDERKQRKSKNAVDATPKAIIPTGFRPIDPKADHGYRINVARDGSMITAVPIEEQPLRSPRGGRPLGGASPILFSQPRSSPNGTSSNGSTTWSQQGLLDARGKQRHKMKRMKPKVNAIAAPTKKSPKTHSHGGSFPNDPFNNVVHTARDKLKNAKGVFAFTGTTNDNSSLDQKPQQMRQETDKSHTPPTPPTQPKHKPRPRSRSKAKAPKVRWDLSPKREKQMQPQSQHLQTAISNSGNTDDADMSFSSFPLLSSHKFDDSAVDDERKEKKSSKDNVTDTQNKNNALEMKKSRNDTNAKLVPDQRGGTQSFEALVQQRMAEIKRQQKDIAEKVSKKDAIKGTLITAIDGNLQRNRKQMKALDDELKELEWHLKLDSKKKQKHQITHAVTKQQEEDVAKVTLARCPSGAYDMYSVNESAEVGDPSITADTDSVAAIFQKSKASRGGRDPPARPSTPTIKEERREEHKRERIEPNGPRISTVLCGNNNIHAESNGANRGITNQVVDESPIRIPSPPTMKSDHSLPKPAPFRPVPLQHNQQIQAPKQRHHHTGQSRQSLAPPQSQQREKIVHFNLPQDSDSAEAELKFESTNSTDSPSADFVGAMDVDGGEEEISWEEEHFDVETYDEEKGSVISSEHHDLFQWTDNEHHVVVSEHYSRENHHRRHYHGEMDDEIKSPRVSTNQNNYNGNRGVSSDSVETDPDLGFIHTVAAIVIQTAVRRFLAEIAVEERMYAVNVIQTAICKWMAHIRRNPFFSGEVFHNNQNMDRKTQEDQDDMIAHGDQNSYRITHDEPKNPISFSQRPPQRKKRVMFEDDYNDFREFSATEIQRCYRGWWARDGLEVDNFAATTIQRMFRSWWAREALDVDRYCAVEIQRIVRGHLSRMSYIYDLYCIIVVQSVVRRYLAFYTSAVRLANILYIQAMFRGYRVRSELMRYVRNGQEVAATFIQSQWRAYDANMNYINTLADILIVQSVARRWLTLREMRKRIARKPKYDSVEYSQTRANYNRRSNVPVAQTRNPNANWQQHRLNIVSRPPTDQYQNAHHGEGLNTFHLDSAGSEEWYSGNKSETSNMLRNWRGRKSK